MASETPLMLQYQQFKTQHPDAVLFMRCGDFYEMFHEDARICSRELQIVLTSRNKTSDNPIPMAGVPWHAYEDYAAKLIRKGYKVAICEQVEDPKDAKGIVKREITQVITPGTVTLSGVLSPQSNNFLAALQLNSRQIHLSFLDVSTGEGNTTTFAHSGPGLISLREELVRLHPAELLIHRKLYEDPLLQSELLPRLVELNFHFRKIETPISKNTPLFREWIPKRVLHASGLSINSPCRFSWELLFGYMEQCTIQTELVSIQSYSVEEKLLIDPGSIRNLELLTTMYDDSSQHSLLNVLDATVTAAGARLLRHFMLAPLLNIDEINARLDNVAALIDRPTALENIRSLLRETYDLFRLVNRLVNQQANGRDLVAILQSLAIIPRFIEFTQTLPMAADLAEMDNLQLLCNLIESAIVDEPSQKITEGGIIKEGFCKELDHYLALHKDADGVLREMEETERKRTGIKGLKIRFNRVFGYYVEVPKAQAHLLPEEFSRRQTLSNAERFTSAKLKAQEKEIIQAQEEVRRLEYQIFCDVRQQILDKVHILQRWAETFAFVDIMASFAIKSLKGHWSRPQFTEQMRCSIIDGRHPVVEETTTSFVPNDLLMDREESLVHIITGPNMGGKSTYLRQSAILILMAQMGCFVPAASYECMIFDRIFTRVGASDDLGSGKSTFMVEMAETAYLLKHATNRSLVLLDEVGRGTATFDGLSLAWSVVEYIVKKLQCLTLFATHYHELTQIHQLDAKIKNYYVSVLESQGEVIFQHKIKRGSADRSYGIHVARLAGMPTAVTRRAKSILKDLESSRQAVIGLDTQSKKLCVQGAQKSLFAAKQEEEINPLIELLQSIDPDSLSPRDAISTIFDLKDALERWQASENS